MAEGVHTCMPALMPINTSTHAFIYPYKHKHSAFGVEKYSEGATKSTLLGTWKSIALPRLNSISTLNHRMASKTAAHLSQTVKVTSRHSRDRFVLSSVLRVNCLPSGLLNRSRSKHLELISVLKTNRCY